MSHSVMEFTFRQCSREKYGLSVTFSVKGIDDFSNVLLISKI